MTVRLVLRGSGPAARTSSCRRSSSPASLPSSTGRWLITPTGRRYALSGNRMEVLADGVPNRDSSELRFFEVLSDSPSAAGCQQHQPRAGTSCRRGSGRR